MYCSRAITLLFFSFLGTAPAGAFIINVDPLNDEPLFPWASTASGRRSHNGQPAILTWSFVPDGTTIEGGLEFGRGSSDLQAFLNRNFDGDEQQNDLTQQPWFRYFAASFERWGELGGVTYLYEPADDGGIHDDRRGELGVRGDIRIGGMSLDGQSGTLAFNFLPEGGSDMVLDTDDVSFFTNSSGDFVRLRNTIMHEHGHGFGLQHVTSSSDDLLMEPSINVSFDGPQLDEVRGVHFYFGDRFEEGNGLSGNDSPPLATALGTIAPGRTRSIGTDANVTDQRLEPTATDFVSISNDLDVDVFSFEIAEISRLDADLTPLGGVFRQASQFEVPTLFDASARNDLALEILDLDGQAILATADETGLGSRESLESLLLPSAGTYYARVRGAGDKIQLYQLDLSVTALLPGDYNRDSVVDEADYTVWRNTQGRTEIELFSGADGNADGQIDVGDYDVWKANFGRTLLRSESAVVAEPQGALLLIVAAVALCTPHRLVGQRCIKAR